jgi:hypothetical protein
MNRREWLLSAGVMASLAATGVSLGHTNLLAEIRRLLAEPDQDSTLAALAHRIVFRGSHEVTSVRPRTDDELRHMIRANIQADFRDGRTARCAGWILSATEADAVELVRRLHVT